MSDFNGPSQDRHNHVGHDHFWTQALSRRKFLSRAASATAAGAVLGSGFAMPPLGLADDEAVSLIEPKPIPGGSVTPFAGVISHHFRPARGIEASTITDFNGFVGLAEFELGTGTGTTNGATMPLFFGVDNRFMVGEFVGSDGEVHRGAFVEI